MKYNYYSLKHHENEERTVRKFLWIPRQFDFSETRWLEFANIREKVKRKNVGVCDITCVWLWVEVGFDD